MKIIFKAAHGQVPANIEEAVFHTAHLESHQLEYQKAAQRIADRSAQAQLEEEMLQLKHNANEKHKSIGSL